MIRAWILFALAACDPADPPRRVVKPTQPAPATPPTQDQVNSLRTALGEAREQSKTMVPGGMSSCARVNSFTSFSNSAPNVTPFRKTAFDQNDPTTWVDTPRNSPCPCGSGKKYKHCHGAL